MDTSDDAFDYLHSVRSLEETERRNEALRTKRLADVKKSKRRNQAAASVLTQDWLPPTLGSTGLLGIG